MQPIQVHPVSALLGAVAAGCVILAAGATQAPGEPGPPDRLEVVTDPRPSRIVRIVEGEPYTVPEGMTFVLTALGSTEFVPSEESYWVSLEVGGTVELQTPGGLIGVVSGFSVQPVPEGFAVGAGEEITVTSGTGAQGRAWGYESDV
ncbi:MAG: hypothetical protein AAF682_17355 [Planctomycetota bacterium]